MTSWSSSSEPRELRSGPLRARRLDVRHRDAALDCLAVRARANLLLLDVAHGLGRRPPAGLGRPELIGAFAGERLVGVASLRPSILLDAGLGEAGRRHLYPLDLEVLVERAPLLGLDRQQMVAALPRLRGEPSLNG